VKVLVLNVGSSSIKYQLFDMPEGGVAAKGKVERIGEPLGSVEQQSKAGGIKHEETIPDHGVGLERAIECLTRGNKAPLKDVREIGAVGHRVVHGGERFTQTVLIDDEVVAAIEANQELAPLHNPPNLLGIRVARRHLPQVPQVAVFDTAFHQTMPETAYLYAVPLSLYREHKVRRYGFHGTSHRYVSGRAAAMLKKPLNEVNLITCHLGNGSSMAAVKNGKSVDTSMGLTPLEGLVMGTRSGDIDPAIIFYLGRIKNWSNHEIDDLLNKKSGLLGLAGKSNDVRELLDRKERGDQDAERALAVFTYRIKKYVGAYVAALGRLDALVFTAGIGENSPFVRAQVCAGLEVLGLAIDEAKNMKAVAREIDISAAHARSRVLVIPTDEEKMIATDTYELARYR
jgi:acetate kinase